MAQSPRPNRGRLIHYAAALGCGLAYQQLIWFAIQALANFVNEFLCSALGAESSLRTR